MSKVLEIKKRVLNSRLAKDSFWALFGNIIGKGLALAAGIIVARFLGKDIYGEYGIIRNTLMSIAIFSTFGLGYTATKYVAEYKYTNPEYIKSILRYSLNITLIVSGIMAIGLFLGSTYVAEIVLEAPHLAIPLRIIAILIVFNAVTTTQIGVLSGFGDFKGMARVNTIIGVLTFLTSFIFTYYWGFTGALAALLLTQILNWWLNYKLVIYNLSLLGSTVIKEKTLLKEILNFSCPVALQEALFSITYWLTSIVLIKLSSYGELGLYSAAMQWYAIVLFIPGILRNVILSHLAEANNNEQRHDRVLKITLIFNFLMTFIPFLIVFFFSGVIASFYGASFKGLSELINIAVFTAIFSSLSNVYTQAYMSKGKNWLMFLIRTGRDGGIVVVSFLFLSKTSGYFGSLSVMYAFLIINICFCAAMVLIYNLKFKNN